MSRSSCREVEAAAPEFALGLVSGAERAAVVDHLAQCVACREVVDGLAATVDALVAAGPSAEPPGGFEARVLARLDAGEGAADAQPTVEPPTSRRRRTVRGGRRWPLVVAAAAAVMLLLASGVALGRASAPGHERGVATAATVRQASMVTAGGRRVGRATVGVDPDTVFVAVPGWLPSGYEASASYRLRLTLADGRSTIVGPVRLADGTWGTVLPLDGAQVRRVAMIDAHGAEYCAARF